MVSKYDYVFLIPSYNRYEKLINLINQIKNIDDYLIIILNDGSTDDRYVELENNYKNIEIIKNGKNNGKDKFNLTIKSILEKGITVNGDYFILLADDLILCDDFTKILDNFVQENYIINVLSLNDTMWNIPGWIDGAFVSSKGGLLEILNLIPKSIKTYEGRSTGIWSLITKVFFSKKNKYKIKNLNYSLTQHNGNDDSKLHPRFRVKNPIISPNFYDNFKGNEIKIITKEPEPIILKKKPEKTEGIDTKTAEIPIVKETKPVIKSVIDVNFNKLQTENKNKPHISKIHNDLFLGKLRKQNINIKGRR